MVQSITIPLEWANNIPGVSGIRDVDFTVPEVDDVVDPILDAIPDLDAIRAEIDDALDDFDVDIDIPDLDTQAIADDLVEAIEEATGIDFPDPDEVADAVADRLGIESIDDVQVDIQGSLFAIEDDLVNLIQNALADADVDDILDGGITEEIVDAVSEATEGALDDLLPDWLTQPIEDTAQDLVEAVFNQGVDETTQDALAETVDRTNTKLEEAGIR